MKKNSSFFFVYRLRHLQYADMLCFIKSGLTKEPYIRQLT